jgi:hypothetical protein
MLCTRTLSALSLVIWIFSAPTARAQGRYLDGEVRDSVFYAERVESYSDAMLAKEWARLFSAQAIACGSGSAAVAASAVGNSIPLFSLVTYLVDFLPAPNSVLNFNATDGIFGGVLTTGFDVINNYILKGPDEESEWRNYGAVRGLATELLGRNSTCGKSAENFKTVSAELRIRSKNYVPDSAKYSAQSGKAAQTVRSPQDSGDIGITTAGKIFDR